MAVDPDAARGRLRELIEDVIGADDVRYGAADDAGHSMDCAKVIQDAAGDYLAVYHWFHDDGRFHVGLAVSPDLSEWAFAQDLGRSASQPTIYAVPDAGYLVAWEQEPRNHIAVRYYPDREALLAGRPVRSFDARRSLSRCAEGTPSIHAVNLEPDLDHSVIEIGAHYWWKCDRDRQMHATLTGFRRWTATARPDLDEPLLGHGVDGNIGGRDPVEFLGHSFRVVEGQFVEGDFGSWRPFVWDAASGTAEQARVRTDGGSTAFANPHVTPLTDPQGRRALMISLFVPGEGAAPGEGGPLLYRRAY
ncbi:MAG TPA: hypothetical protein VGZ32_14115 [Actinocrinis sp.]|jgi:hypothetical protein|uniref:hypothetical protein n=1 Tax=Actinocrinis sp. TaxID=1920516 RepID=UPI002DDCF354|nr:hypothetical protein [Actinocrinis sp.]HEV3171481.1 hypothetical protein [Actinocrinis sp.]